MSVLMSDLVETDCPLCGEDLGIEQHFHLVCAKRENARSDFEGEGNEPDVDDPIQSIEWL